MRRVNRTNFVDALMQGVDRFNTLKNITAIEPVDIIFTDKYSMVSVARDGEEEIAIKVFFDQDEERARMIKDSVNLLQDKKLPFVIEASLIKDELEIISQDTLKSDLADVIIIKNIYPSIFDYIEMEDEGDSDIVSEFIKCANNIIVKRTLFDKLSADDFCITADGEVAISQIGNIIYSPTAAYNDNNFRAFTNFLTGTLLTLIIDEKTAEEGEGEILYSHNNRTFDLRATDYFLSGEFCGWLLEMMTIIEDKCSINCEQLRQSLSSFSTSEIIAAFNSSLISSEQTRTIHNLTNYDIIGNSKEDRIAVVNKENGLIGYLDFDYNLIIECIYQEASDFTEGVAVCVKNELYGAINRYGEEILPFKYKKIVWSSKKNEFTITKGKETYTKDRFSVTSK